MSSAWNVLAAAVRSVAVLLGLLGLPAVEAHQDSRDALLREQLRNLPREPISFDEEPWREIRSRGDFVGSLIQAAENPAPGELKGTGETVLHSVLFVLREFSSKYPDTKADDYFRRVALDRARDFQLRLDAGHYLALAISPRVAPVYVEVLRGYPEIASPFISALDSLSREGSPLGKASDLYTPEVREALKEYYARRSSDPRATSAGIKGGQDLLARLDQMTARPVAGAAVPTAGRRSPLPVDAPWEKRDPPLPLEKSSETPRSGAPPSGPANAHGGMAGAGVVGALVVGIIAFAFFRKK